MAVYCLKVSATRGVEPRAIHGNRSYPWLPRLASLLYCFFNSLSVLYHPLLHQCLFAPAIASHVPHKLHYRAGFQRPILYASRVITTGWVYPFALRQRTFVTTLSRWTLQIYAPHETLMQILYPLLHTQCLQCFQENDFLKPAPRLSKSRLQIFFQLFSVFEDWRGL